MMKVKTTVKWASLMIAGLLATNLAFAFQDADVVLAEGLSLSSSREQDLSKLPKMERDIVILQNVLNDLFRGSRGEFYSHSGAGAKGIYVPGKGVIFNIKSFTRYGSYILADSPTMVISQSSDAPDTEEEDEKSQEEINKENEAKIKSLSKDFLVNYGSILSELKSGEKVMLNVEYTHYETREKSKSRNGQYFLAYGGQNANRRLVSSIDNSEIESYLNGKQSLDAAANKVTQEIVDDSEQNAMDAKIMAGILDDLFKSNFEGTFMRGQKTSWTYFKGFGLMYDLNLAAGRGGLVTLYGSASGTRSVSKSDRQKKAEEQQKKAEDSFEALMDLVTESLVTYGRTLRSVKSDEVVILNINFGSFYRKTKIPRSVRLQVTKAQIEAFSRGSKSLEQLKNEIEITTLKASATFGTTVYDVHDFPIATQPSQGKVEIVAPDRGRIR